MGEYVTRAGRKLEGALRHFGVQVAGRDALDLGTHKGGFADCLLSFGAASLTVVDTAYGILDWKIRNDPRVTVLERTNALTARMEGPFDLITIDLGWTPQRLILPRALEWAGPRADVLSLVKPQYETAPSRLKRGVLPPDKAEETLLGTIDILERMGVHIEGWVRSCLPGKAGNTEYFIHIRRP